MKLIAKLRSYWPEALLAAAVALPWLSLLALGLVWLWQGNHVWKWALAALVLGLLTWPLTRFVRRRANAEARIELGEMAEPSESWHVREREAWGDVIAIADATTPPTFAEIEPLVDLAKLTVEAVARRLHPDAREAWAQFTLPEFLLLAERLARDVRREALAHIPGIKTLRLGHLLWVRQQNERYGALAKTGWRAGYTLWRLTRAVINPIQAAAQEGSGSLVGKAADAFSYRLRAVGTRMLVLEVGRAAIELYSGRLALTDAEMRAAQEREAAASDEPVAPVRIVLTGQVNAGKSSLVNALAKETRSAVAPVPTTARVAEYRLESEGRPAVCLIDMPGFGDGTDPDFMAQADRADLVLWVASAVQPARAPDRQGLDKFRAWAGTQHTRRPPPLLLALTHVDELRPAGEWKPPYDIAAPVGPKAGSIRSSLDSVARTLDVPADTIVPVAMPPGEASYNMDALWARIAAELDDARLAQLDRLRIGAKRTSLREVTDQLGRAGRFILKHIVRP
ncbi:MAG TPA: GTPase [Xanthobacteraceae bacterium]|nr:GTPase [Xanthobacteraceae bacterium]